MQVAASKDASNKERGVFSLMKERSNCASRLPVVTALVAVSVLFGLRPAVAADLGGDCCADLEERVAELEATTVRKGNKKVKVELYGRMNRTITWWDDGQESNVYNYNNSYNTSRFGIRGKGKISDDWTSLFVIEIEDRGNQSKFANQF